MSGVYDKKESSLEKTNHNCKNSWKHTRKSKMFLAEKYTFLSKKDKRPCLTMGPSGKKGTDTQTRIKTQGF